MEYRVVPKTNDRLSALGFGCMRLPLDKNHGLDQPRAIAQIRYAIDQGVNYLDTAWPYHSGQSEPLLGKALAEGYRERVKLATKLPSWMVESRDQMDEFLDKQLKRLNTDALDYYLIHNLAGPIWDKLKAMDVLEFIDAAKTDGRIINAGFSFHGHIDAFKTIVDDYPWEICQIQYNFLDEYHQAGTEGLEYAASKNLGVIVMEPLRGGNLGGQPPAEVAEVWNRADTARPPVEWALRWIWDRPEVTVVLSGMNEEDHIKENLRIADQARPLSLTPRESDLVKEASDTYKRLMKVGCTGCEYCKPCPAGVNISAAFEVLNKYHLFKKREESKFLYAIRCGGIFSATGEPGFASQCVQCNECLDKCPQSIPIPEALEWAIADLEDELTPQRLAQGKKMLME